MEAYLNKFRKRLVWKCIFCICPHLFALVLCIEPWIIGELACAFKQWVCHRSNQWVHMNWTSEFTNHTSVLWNSLVNFLNSVNVLLIKLIVYICISIYLYMYIWKDFDCGWPTGRRQTSWQFTWTAKEFRTWGLQFSSVLSKTTDYT